MKTLSLFIILAVSSLNLSAQDTASVRERVYPGGDSGGGSDDRYFPDIRYDHSEARRTGKRHKLITETQLIHRRNLAIIFSSLSGGFTIGGLSLVIVATRPDFQGDNTGYVAGGAAMIGVGADFSIGGLATWIAYAVKLNKFKRQEQKRGVSYR